MIYNEKIKNPYVKIELYMQAQNCYNKVDIASRIFEGKD